MISFKFGAEQPKAKLNQLGKQLAGVQVTFGYRSPYAVFVHENMEMKLRGHQRPSRLGAYWDAEGGQPGQSKFLEQPFREMVSDGTLQQTIVKYARQVSVEEGVRKAAEQLLAESRTLVPSEYGDLRKSTYISVPQPLGTQSIREAKKPVVTPKAKAPTSMVGRAWSRLKQLFGFGKK